MTGEFSYYCNLYYRLKIKLTKQDVYFYKLLGNALPYTNQRCLTELDEIIKCNRAVQAAKAKVYKTYAQLVEAGEAILKFMDYFEVPPGGVLTGEIPGELEYHIWRDEDNLIGIRKIADLTPEPLPSNFIVIKCWREEEED
jgi:hypothetical protein